MIPSQRPDLPQISRRRGLVSVAMLVGLLILGIIAGGLVKVAMGRRSAARTEENRQQAELLAESGIARALTRLEANSHYEGEVWEIAADDLGGRGPARVTISVQTAPDPTLGRSITAVADHLTSSAHPIRLTRTIRLPLPPAAR